MLAVNGWGWFGFGIIGLIIWVLIAFWPARVARRKGHSWLLFFIFSLIFFFGALIVAYIIPDRRRYSDAGFLLVRERPRCAAETDRWAFEHDLVRTG